MDRRRKARIILQSLSELVNINWNFEKHYLRAIENGLDEIRRKELAAGEKNKPADGWQPDGLTHQK